MSTKLSPVAICLVPIWLGVSLDVASTWGMTIIDTSDRFVELNPLITPEDPQTFFIANFLSLLALSALAATYYIDTKKVDAYLAKTSFRQFIVDSLSFRYSRKCDYVSMKTVSIVAVMVTAGSAGCGRFFAFINNTLEYLFDIGLVRFVVEKLSYPDMNIFVPLFFTATMLAAFPLMFVLIKRAAFRQAIAS